MLALHFLDHLLMVAVLSSAIYFIALGAEWVPERFPLHNGVVSIFSGLKVHLVYFDVALVGLLILRATLRLLTEAFK